MEIKDYFSGIDNYVSKAYNTAKKAKSKGYDPSDEIEIIAVNNMGEKVEGLVSVIHQHIKGKGIPSRIIELEETYGKLDWRVALTIALETAQEKFCKFKDEIEAMEAGIRVGFAYITLGSVSSPLEGFVKLVIKKRKDGKEYFCLYYSGPVRSAGGTGASVSVIIADYLRKKLGYYKYDATEKEIKRTYTELTDYHEKVTNLQYFPSEQEVEFLVSNLPVQIDGDPSEKYEVSNYKDLDRIETNRLRNGFCLVIAECLAQKAPKILWQLQKWGKDFDMADWEFMNDFVSLQKRLKSKQKIEDTKEKIKADYTYLKDIVAGRPVLTYPYLKGGFRLRYGRCRNSGLSSMAIHPATMIVLKNFIAIGTQLKVERPGKGTALGSCDTIEGPIVKLNNGDVVFLEDCTIAEGIANDVKEILFLGDILVNYGDFLNRNHILIPAGYCEEWWAAELEKSIKNEKINKSNADIDLIKDIINNPMKTKVHFDESYKISKIYNIPLHPRYTLHWNDLTTNEYKKILEKVKNFKIDRNTFKIMIPSNLDIKKILEKLGLPHRQLTDNVLVEGDWSKSFLVGLGILNNKTEINNNYDDFSGKEETIDAVNTLSEIKIIDKSGTCIGARMGRPEKAKLRKLTGSPHVLFPVGEEGGRLRAFQSAIESNLVYAEFPIYFCKECSDYSIYRNCHRCGKKTMKMYFCEKCNKQINKEICTLHGKTNSYNKRPINIVEYMELAKKRLDLSEVPELIKGIRGTSNEGHVTEYLSKGILRATYNLAVNKDGTIRYDMTETSLTHFKPKEIGTSVEKLKELGYGEDIYGMPLENKEQILELNVQDVILPACVESLEEGADTVLFRISKFIDDLLSRLYKCEGFYNLNDKKELVGHLIIGLAPHTSAGIIGRIIGFTKTQGCYAHPMWHCAIRRDCDGDECGVMLLMDGLLNFSRKFLPAHRGSTQDAPLVLTTKLIPSEVDDMVFDMDICWRYPLEFYEACLDYKMPNEMKLDIVKRKLGSENQYQDFGFTHDTSDINLGVRCSAYKSLPSMLEKVRGQMELAEMIRAVDTDDVARLVIERHFIRDIRGNLRKFSMQQFRCSKCNQKYRRPPLIGKCLKCDGRIIFTISEGSIVKYLKPSLELANKYKLSPYLKQSLELTKSRIESLFGKEKEVQAGLNSWFS
ncbi:DNA polymerase II large subunit [Candidatus Woesearchaeota archaeon]|nr:DNA polymerase II large subunit [Candidatus Woesearchaeota archaeon]